MDCFDSRRRGAAFLLAQLGSHSAERFGERLKPLNISRSHAGILRIIEKMQMCNQLSLSKRLGILPSRMVALIDELAEKGLVERRRNEKDRRNLEILLTDEGNRMMKKLSKVAAQHDQEICAVLTDEEYETLVTLCRKIADDQALIPGVHPGLRGAGN
jgi:DNA-binding MarR family transcriptional regulator